MYVSAPSLHERRISKLLLLPADSGSMVNVLWARVFVLLVNMLRAGFDSTLFGRKALFIRSAKL
jgi:hypothetical protein